MQIALKVTALALFLFISAPASAEPATSDESVTAAPAADQANENEDAVPCAAAGKGKCCSSPACAEAKFKANPKEAMATCPCMKNRLKPKHGGS